MRRLLGLLLVLALLVLVGSCKSVWDDVKSDISGSVTAWHRDWAHAKDSIFRHLLNYDENDPYL
jgi:hypothetical protein